MHTRDFLPGEFAKLHLFFLDKIFSDETFTSFDSHHTRSFFNEKVLLSAMPSLSSKLNRMLSELKVVTFMRNRKTHTLILASIRTAYAILKKERCYIYTKILILANDDNFDPNHQNGGFFFFYSPRHYILIRTFLTTK